MKNYKDSDYALNKFSEGIVYRFADRIVEITLEDYLAENPGKTAQDFLELKALSDEIYHQQGTHENRTSRLDVSINGLEETEQLAAPPLDLDLIHKSDTRKAKEAARRLLDSGELTEIQRRRFILYFVEGLSYRQIASREEPSTNPSSNTKTKQQRLNAMEADLKERLAEIKDMEDELEGLADDIDYYESQYNLTPNNSYANSYNDAVDEYNDIYNKYDRAINEYIDFVEEYNALSQFSVNTNSKTSSLNSETSKPNSSNSVALKANSTSSTAPKTNS